MDFLSRSVGMMLIGVALYRNGVITGTRSAAFYRRMAMVGLGVGLPARCHRAGMGGGA